MWLFCRRKRQSFLEGSDRFSYSAALGATLVRLGNLFNSEIVGRRTDQTWGFYFPRFDRDAATPLYRHPSQIYEITLGLLVMLALYLVDKKFGKEKRPRGLMIATFFATYFTGRFVVEYFKEIQVAAEEGFPLTRGQLLSILPALVGYWGVYWSIKKGVPAHWYTDADDAAEELDEDEEDEEEGADNEAEALAPEQRERRDADVDAEFEK
jgi:phosphatidylglycerol---prolipoprotein diacylglyceryl transferase